MEYPQGTYESTHENSLVETSIPMEKLHRTNTCIHILPRNSKHNIDIYPPYPFQYNLLYHLKTPSPPPNLIIIKPNQYIYHTQLLYNFWIHIIPQILLPTIPPFNYRQNDYMLRYYFKGSHPISCIIFINHCCW